jgi:hypothetical protein
VNRSTETTAHDQTARIARVAWLCAFVLPLVLAGLLLGVKSVQATGPPPSLTPFAFEEEGEEELALEEEEEEDGGDEEAEAEFAEAECEIAEEEAAEGEITQADAEALCKEAQDFARAGPSSTAERCPIRSTRAHASLRRHRLKLTIGYTTTDPTKATIQIRKVGTFKRQLGRSGVIRITKKLGKKQPGRVVISIKAPSCARPTISATKVR